MSNHSSVPLDDESSENMEKFSALIEEKSSILSQLMNNEAKNKGFGETNNFPEGKITKADEGEIKFGVTLKDEKVIINFGKPVVWLGMTRDQAEELGRLLIDKAKGIGIHGSSAGGGGKSPE